MVRIFLYVPVVTTVNSERGGGLNKKGWEMSHNLCLLSKKKNLRRITGHTTISVDRPLI